MARGAKSDCRTLLVCLQTEVEPLQRMFEKFINKMLAFKKDNCTELVPLPEYSGIVSLCKLYSALATPENGVSGVGAEPGQEGLMISWEQPLDMVCLSLSLNRLEWNRDLQRVTSPMVAQCGVCVCMCVPVVEGQTQDSDLLITYTVKSHYDL